MIRWLKRWFGARRAQDPYAEAMARRGASNVAATAQGTQSSGAPPMRPGAQAPWGRGPVWLHPFALGGLLGWWGHVWGHDRGDPGPHGPQDLDPHNRHPAPDAHGSPWHGDGMLDGHPHVGHGHEGGDVGSYGDGFGGDGGGDGGGGD